MKPLNIKSPVSHSGQYLLPILFLLFISCAPTRETIPILGAPAPLIPYYQAQQQFARLQQLATSARIAIEADFRETVLFASLIWYQRDSLIVQLKDPLRRKLARGTLSDTQYELWLLRKKEYYAGVEPPDFLKEYGLADFPLGLLGDLLIGYPRLPDSLLTRDAASSQIQVAAADDWSYRIHFDSQYQYISRIDILKGKIPHIHVQYTNYQSIEQILSLPHFVRITTADGYSIQIQYSKFRAEFLKLS